MIFLDFLWDKTQVVALEEEADRVLEELAGLKSLKKQFDHVSNDVNIMFHRAHNDHHDAHVRCQAFQIPDLLYVSHAYLRRLPEIYDAHLSKELFDYYFERGFYPKNKSSFNEKLQNKKGDIEKLLFYINASEILSEHVKHGKTEYCQQIADRITQKNIESMGSIRLKIKSDSGSQRSENFFQRITALILQRPQKPKWTEEPLFDQERLSLILGNDSPYRDLLYCPYHKDSDNTAERLFEITQEGGHPNSLRIPQISDSNYQPQELNTPNFSRLSVSDENSLKGILDKFLPARRRLETEFWEKYLGAHCLLPESLSR
jgi:hypothetical protein